MYTSVLFLHSWLRWAVLLLGLLALARAIAGAAGRRPWVPADEQANKFFLIALDIQIVLGLILYFFLSPITGAAMADFGAAMKSSGLRFWSVEHVFGVVVALILAHRGRARVRAITDPVRKHRVAAVFLLLALLAIAASIPWPGTPNARELFRF
jgi:hypothetical protein